MDVSQNLTIYLPVAILMFFGVIGVVGALVVGRLVRPSKPQQLKLQPYECGESPTGVAWSNFNVRFYVVSLIFIIFDVESVLIFPAAAVYKDFVDIGLGLVALISLLLFILVLLAGVVYCWKKGDLDWVKSFDPKKLKHTVEKANV